MINSPVIGYPVNPWKYIDDDIIISLIIEILNKNKIKDYKIFPAAGCRTLWFKSHDDAGVAIKVFDDFYRELIRFMNISKQHRDIDTLSIPTELSKHE